MSDAVVRQGMGSSASLSSRKQSINSEWVSLPFPGRVCVLLRPPGLGPGCFGESCADL